MTTYVHRVPALRMGFTIFIDANRDGNFDDDEQSDVTGETGRWSFDNLDSGVYVVRIVGRNGFDHTTPIRLRIELEKGQISNRILFGQQRDT